MTAVDAADAIAVGDARAGEEAATGAAPRFTAIKYASPRPFDSRPPRESQPYEPPPPGYEPIILPGESLAKYKDRRARPRRPRLPRNSGASTAQVAPGAPQTFVPETPPRKF